MLNIPSTINDPNYRYKMPRLNLKIESKGNGIKTNIVNLPDVAKHLQTNEQYILKWFGFEKGSQTMSKQTTKNNKTYIINGQYGDQDFQKTLDKFIDKYICCPKCKYPELNMLVKDGKIVGKCDSCPFMGDLDNKHKLAAFILKNPPAEKKKKPTEELVKKEKIEKKKGAKEEKKEDQQIYEKEQTAADLFDPATLEFKSKELQQLVQYCRKFLELHKEKDISIKCALLVSQLKPLGLKKPIYAYIIFNAIFTINIAKQIKQNAETYNNLMKKLVQTNIQIETMTLREKKDFSKYIPTILMQFYQSNILSKQFLDKWSAGTIEDIQKTFLYVPGRDSEFLKLSQQFIEYLKQQDEEDQQTQQ